MAVRPGTGGARALAFAGLATLLGVTALIEPRTLTTTGRAVVLVLTGTLGLAALVTLNQWLMAATATGAVAGLAVSAPDGVLAVVLGMAAVITVEGALSALKFAGYGQRLPEDAVRRGARVHLRGLVPALLLVVLVLSGIAWLPALIADALGGAAPAALELDGGLGLVLPGLLVLLVPLGVSAARGRGA